MLKEFKEFINRGNVMDMAIGVVLATAFSAIIKALVDNIIMPVIGWLTGGIDFTEWKVVLTPAMGKKPEVAIGYGILIQSIIVFLLVAFCVFLIVKGLNKMRKSKNAADETPAGPTDNELLTQILAQLKRK